MLRLRGTILLLVALTACRGDTASETDGRVVAEIDGRVVTVSQVQDYLDAVLAIGAGDENPEDESISEGDLDRVMSRLFDGFLEEEMLLYEAERRGVQVEPWEVEIYLGREPDEAEEAAEAPDPDNPGYRLARRNLMIQKLRGAVVAGEVEVSEADVDAYLRRHQDRLLPDDHLIVRRLTLAGRKEANDVRREIIEKSMPFDKAATVFGGEPHQGRPEQLEIEALPEVMREAVEKLKPGQISRPVEFDGAYHLFLLEAWPAKKAVDQQQLRARAREELFRIRSGEASARLHDRLREELDIRVFTQHLPFGYVEE
ncbi:MAG: peptidyl-prolyl cis-trans isomerase [Acidobacteriota bacterium]|nr:peptidyl-prolyl cis-trans isomerase [Acidobacteriota bacterium]